jgi:uncharacterized protein (TIGR04551 family)
MRRLHVLLFLALLAPLLTSPAALAQGSPTPASPAAAPSTPTPAAASAPAPAAEPPSARTAPAPAAPAAPSGAAAAINPSRDQRDLAAQGATRPSSGEMVGSAQEVFSEDWWGRARPIIEMHGYFRTRAELFHNFFLGRHNSSAVAGNDPQYLWPIPIDQSYSEVNGTSNHPVAVCGPASAPGQNCYDKTESGANLRLRINPEIAISDNLRILTQLDLLDNLVLGSTPDSYAMQPTTTVVQKYGYASTSAVNAYAPIGFLASTQGPPTAGVNSWTNSIAVKRAWGEYMTPVGQIRFGRMPDHWGLGMVANAGDGVDSDYQTTLDRIQFVSGLKAIDLYFGASWDFVSTGPTNANPFDVYGGQPYNTCNLCNVNEWTAFIARRTNPEIQKLQLARGDLVLNGGLYALYRSQYLDVKSGVIPQTEQPDQSTGSGTMSASTNNGLEPRRAWSITPDLWFQALWNKLRFEVEAVTVQGQIGWVHSGSTPENINTPVNVHQYGVTTQTEFRAVDDKLDLQFGFGWASGDPYAYNTAANNAGFGALQPGLSSGYQLQTEYNQAGLPSPISTFRFHPDYRVDLIFWRNIMSRVEGAYYFRPSVDYDFVRHADGEKLGGGAALIWSRASEFEQTPGHRQDLGVELDLQLYYQSKDGTLNDDPSKIGGFFSMLQYGVFFPLAGLDYLPSSSQSIASGFDTSTSAAQAIRLFLGVVY